MSPSVAPITAMTPQRGADDHAARDWFWGLIDGSRAADEATQLAGLRGGLEALSDQDLVDFIGQYNAVHGGLYLQRLWAAAYLINGGCSDDGFIDFRAWLIAQGRAIAERAAADPDSLAALEVEMDSASFEAFGYVMLDAFRARSDGAFPGFKARAVGHDPDGPEWAFDFDDDAEMRRRLPRLAALYL